jgi:glycine/D-amino acid oxidase-like deaminating enzyme
MAGLSTDVLVIGGGLAGCATAYFLAREGVEVTVVERFDVNTQASGSNAGSLHVQIPHEPFVVKGEGWARAFAPVLPLMLQSVRLWRELGAELGADLEVAITGGILVAASEAEMRDVARKSAVERAQGVRIELLGANELRSLAPYVSERMIGGAFCPDEGKASPLKATPAFAAAARQLGARLLTWTAVTGISPSAPGYLVHTSGGDFRARRVVNCAGAEAARIGAMLGLELPIEGHPIQVAVTEPIAPLIAHLLYSAGEKLTLKQLSNGNVLIGGGWPARRRASDGRLVVDQRSLRDNLRTALEVVPALHRARVVRTWPALVNGTDDWRPILGEAPGRPGFFLNVFPWMGFTAGPLAALTVAELVLGRAPSFDRSAWSPVR